MSKKPSKRYRAAAQVADLKAKYDIAQAAEIIKKMPGAKFDETVEISAFLGVDPKQSDQMVRGTVNLPHGTGKTARVLVFANAAKAEEARAAKDPDTADGKAAAAEVKSALEEVDELRERMGEMERREAAAAAAEAAAVSPE